MTEKNLLWMLQHILLIVNGELTVRHRVSGWVVMLSDNPAATSEYNVYSNGKSSPYTSLYCS